MFSLRSSDGVILSEGLTIPKAISVLNEAFRSKHKKLRVFQGDTYFCDYYLKG